MIYLDELSDPESALFFPTLFLFPTGFSPCQVLYSNEFLKTLSTPHFLHVPVLVGPLGGDIIQWQLLPSVHAENSSLEICFSFDLDVIFLKMRIRI